MGDISTQELQFRHLLPQLIQLKVGTCSKAFGQLVQLGFDVAVFTPAAYRRPRLGRPSKEPSSCGRLRA